MTLKNIFGAIANDSSVRALFKVISKFSFDASSRMRVNVETGSVAVSSGTVTTVGTVTTGNIGYGDIGKNATAQLQSQMNFSSGTRKNFK